MQRAASARKDTVPPRTTGYAVVVADVDVDVVAILEVDVIVARYSAPSQT